MFTRQLHDKKARGKLITIDSFVFATINWIQEIIGRVVSNPRPNWNKESHSDHSSLKVNITITGPCLQNFSYACLLKSSWFLRQIKKFLGQLHNDGNYNLERVRFRQFQTHHLNFLTVFGEFLKSYKSLEKVGFNPPFHSPCSHPTFPRHGLTCQDYYVHRWKRFGCRGKLTFG